MSKFTINLKQDHSLLVVVDMINGFVFEGPISDPSINACTPLIVDYILQYHVAKKPILAFRDAHTETANEFQYFPVHCLVNSHESEFIDAIKIHEDKMITLLKNSTNGFVQPQFLETFKSMLPLNNIVITGCCTDLCVLQFALSLIGYINEHDLATEVIIVKDATETYNSETHNQAQYNDIAYLLMGNAGIKVLESKEIEVLYE